VRSVARIGLGLAALGRPGYLNVGHGSELGDDRSVGALRARTFAVLDYAYAAGIRDFDVARSYGRGEEFLGEWLRAHNPSGVRVSSKWGYVYTAGWEVAHDPPEVKHHDLSTFQRQLAETRENLGEWLTLYQIHSATPDSGVLSNDEVLRAMQETDLPLGISVSGVAQAETIDLALTLGLFDAVQATWNLLERSAEPALEAAAGAGLTVYVTEALANGRLAGREASPALAEAAAAHGTTPDALALAAVLARPWAGVVLSGAATVATLESNLRATHVTWTPELDERLAELREDADAYWERRSALPWT
jgi:aryl-alcohol dehydrogenase-like predicted oxidoreductase